MNFGWAVFWAMVFVDFLSPGVDIAGGWYIFWALMGIIWSE